MAGYFKMVPLAGAVLLPTKGLFEIGGEHCLPLCLGQLLAFSGQGLEYSIPKMHWSAPLDKETPHLELC